MKLGYPVRLYYKEECDNINKYKELKIPREDIREFAKAVNNSIEEMDRMKAEGKEVPEYWKFIEVCPKC